jgi:hypothetical protein
LLHLRHEVVRAGVQAIRRVDLRHKNVGVEDTLSHRRDASNLREHPRRG